VRSALRLALGLVLGAGVLASAAAAGPYRAPRTASGAPDLQGVWTNLSLTRYLRPPEATQLTLDDKAAAELEAKLAAKAKTGGDGVGGRESEWWDGARLGRIDGKVRTSWITSPADGQAPLNTEGQRRRAANQASATAGLDNPETLNPTDRCVIPTWAAVGPPMLNAPYSAYYEIVQTPDHVAILAEMNSEVRIIRLGGARGGVATAGWTGESIGRWEGDTLVVETTGFHPRESGRLAPFFLSPTGKVTERFTRVSPTEIRYAFTVEDPTVLKEPVRGEMPFLASKGPIYESACHEGNYALPGILAGARKAEADAAKAGGAGR
jgi:hypothetical protein